MDEFRIDTDTLSTCNEEIKNTGKLFKSEFTNFSYSKISKHSLLSGILSTIKQRANQIEKDFNSVTTKCTNFIDNIIKVENKMANDEIEHPKIYVNNSSSWRKTSPTTPSVNSAIDGAISGYTYYKTNPDAYKKQVSQAVKQVSASKMQESVKKVTASKTINVETPKQETNSQFNAFESFVNNLGNTFNMYADKWNSGTKVISDAAVSSVTTVADKWQSGAKVVEDAVVSGVSTLVDDWSYGQKKLTDWWESGTNTINNFFDEKWNSGYIAMKQSGGFASATADVFKQINDVATGVRDTTKDAILEINNELNDATKKDLDLLTKLKNNEISLEQAFLKKLEETGATVSQVGLSLWGGLSKGAEALMDTAATSVTGLLSIPSFFIDLFSNNLGTNSSITSHLYDTKDKFVEKDYVGDAQKLLYNDSDFGKWVSDNSAISTDGAVSSVVSGIGQMVTVLSTASALGALAEGTNGTMLATSMSGLKGFGMAEETALKDGASTLEASLYGLASGSWDALQMYAGMKINSWTSSNLTTAAAMENAVKASNAAFSTFATSVALDGVDSSLEGYVQPALQMIYKERQDGESFGDFYNRLFEEMGGAKNVGTQFLIGSLMSAGSTGLDMVKGKYAKELQTMTDRYQELDNIRNTDEYKTYMDDVKNGKEVDPNSNFKNIEQEYASIANELKKIKEAAFKADNGYNDISDDVNARLDAQKLEASGTKVDENDILNSKQNFETKIDDLVAETIQTNNAIKTVDDIYDYIINQYQKNLDLKNKIKGLSQNDKSKLLNELLKNNSQKISDNLEFYYSDANALKFFNQAVNSLDDKNELIKAFKKITDGSDVSIILGKKAEFIVNKNGTFLSIPEADIINQNYDSVYKAISDFLVSRASDSFFDNFEQIFDNINNNTTKDLVGNIMNERLLVNRKILKYLTDAGIVDRRRYVIEYKKDMSESLKQFLDEYTEHDLEYDEKWKRLNEEILTNMPELRKILVDHNVNLGDKLTNDFLSYEEYQYKQAYGPIIEEFYNNNPNIKKSLNGCCEFISSMNVVSLDKALYGLDNIMIKLENKSLRDSFAIFTKYKLENNEVALSQIKEIFGDEFYDSFEKLYNENMLKMQIKEIPKNEILAQNMDLFDSAEETFKKLKDNFENWEKENAYLNSLSESEREAYYNSQIKPENKEYIDRLEKAFMHNDDPNLNSASPSFNLFKRAMNELLENNPEYGKLFIDAFIFTQKESNISFTANLNEGSYYAPSSHTINFDEMIIKNNDYGTAYHEATHLLDGEFKQQFVSEFRPERNVTFFHDVRSSIDETNLTKILDERGKLRSMLKDYAREKVDMVSIKRQFIESREKVIDAFINKYKLSKKSFENSELSNEELQRFNQLLDSLHFKKRFIENNLPKNMETLKSLEEIYESYKDAVFTKAIEQKRDNVAYQFYDKMAREVSTYDELLTSLYGGRDNFSNKFNDSLYGHSDDYYVVKPYNVNTLMTDEGLAEFSRLTLTKNETGLKQLKVVLGEDLYNYYDEYFNNLMDHIKKTIYNNEN